MACNHNDFSDDEGEYTEKREIVDFNNLHLISKNKTSLIPAFCLAAKNSKFSTLQEAKYYYKQKVNEEFVEKQETKHKLLKLTSKVLKQPVVEKIVEPKVELPKYSKNMEEKKKYKKDEQIIIRTVDSNNSTQLLQLLYESTKMALLNGNTNIRIIIDKN